MGQKSVFIEEFINMIPKEEHSEKTVETGTIHLMDLFNERPLQGKDGYYHYKGSLTTPPYSESVYWYVSKHIYEASPEQIERINKIEGNNARHVQALYGRKVESN